MGWLNISTPSSKKFKDVGIEPIAHDIVACKGMRVAPRIHLLFHSITRFQLCVNPFALIHLGKVQFYSNPESRCSLLPQSHTELRSGHFKMDRNEAVRYVIGNTSSG